ncbi:class I SAM-dependent methyltransferase [Nostoc sp. CHAB 5715]|uniref:class I SAM-dependent methyltransferase n=1 Tax=Nostoc sp. CHAB 5715 TaxID=2780400 RepID=UPI001E55FA02|nr:class I SAM-dependent methyltransferase [Nostoc sp. CHAB 5715]MCC5621013.1 class I SAM-dependent methyltransferase [Nostoc sp. CHAB 5715]
MATILRDWSYRYQWLYDGISRLAALSVGGEARFRQLALQGLTIHSDTQVLDLCCGSGQTTQFLVKLSQNVTGLDASPKSLQRARQNVPLAVYLEGFAEKMPFADNLFDVVHTSVALHEMQPEQLRKIISEVYRVLRPEGIFTLVDFHAPTNPIFWPGVSVFLLLFETETAWQLLKTDLPGLLTETGFNVSEPTLYAGGSLQVIQAQK